MGNTILTPSIIAKEALMQLKNNTVMANLVHRDYSNEFVAGVGDTVTIRKPATFEAKEFDRTSGIDVQDAVEGSATVKLDKLLDVSFEVTAEQLTMDIADFSEQLLIPAMEAFGQKIDTYLTGLYIDVPYAHGTAGTTPATISDITGTRKIMNDNKVPFANRSLVINTAAEDKLLQLDTFIEADKVGDNGTALREASLGRKMGFNIFMDQNIKDHTKGDLDANATATVDVSTDATKVTVASGGNKKTVKKGDVVKFADVAGIYVVIADAVTDVDGAGIFNVYPALKANITSKKITVTGNHSANLAFHKNAFALVSRPLALPNGLGDSQKAIVNYDGFGLRVIYDYNSQYKKDVISIDMLCGVKTLTPELACRLLG